jgi:hypothetical protein
MIKSKIRYLPFPHTKWLAFPELHKILLIAEKTENGKLSLTKFRKIFESAKR